MRRALLVAGLIWLVIAGGASVRSQSSLNSRVQQIEDRTRQAEADAHSQKLALETRLTKLEVQLESVVWLLKGAAGAIGLHLVSSFAGLILRRKGGNGGD